MALSRYNRIVIFVYRILSKTKYQISLFLREPRFQKATEQINQLGIHGISLKKLITRIYIYGNALGGESQTQIVKLCRTPLGIGCKICFLPH